MNQADTALANLAKLQEMREKSVKAGEFKRNTLHLFSSNIEEVPDFEESTPLVRNSGSKLNLNDPFNTTNPTYDHQIKLSLRMVGIFTTF